MVTITLKGLERFGQWSKFEASGDIDIFNMAAMIEAEEEATENHIAVFAGIIEAGTAEEYLAKLKKNSQQEDYDVHQK